LYLFLAYAPVEMGSMIAQGTASSRA